MQQYLRREMAHFNPRTREGCDLFVFILCDYNANFNPRTREGCDEGLTVAVSRTDISIHAPVKGATSIFASILTLLSYFNPRTREGCDLAGVIVTEEVEHISIHAPVKGATAFKLAQSLSALSSIILRTD